jgi:isoleucyl-tRNA synthetase
MADDFKKTLNLPETTFPMKANLAKREPEFLAFWKENRIYEKMVSQREGNAPYILHDGPPYANGNIHIGTAFNKVLKDLFPKYKTLRGYYSPYVPGWDTHGLPIELHVLKSEGVSKDSIDPVELRKQCTEYALKYRDIQRGEFIRLGVFGDWDNPYMTLFPEYEAAQLGAFADMVEKGLVYRGEKPVFWCIDCQTALAAAEIEYWDEKSPSVFVAYSLPEAGKRFPQLGTEDVNVIVWTTTPWTLPASMAVAVGPEYDYLFAKAGKKTYLFAKSLKESLSRSTGLVFSEDIITVKGRELEGLFATHPFYGERRTPVVLAEYVELNTGTGCVHTAPGHGVEDYETGIRYGIEVYNPVDDSGYFVPETPLVGGLSLDDGAKKVLETLRGNGRLLGIATINHSYPHCWRCKKPVIFRSTKQWFVKVSDFREEALSAIDNDVAWVPEWGKDRIYNMVRDRSDWCISRQRVWGVPIPSFTCTHCGTSILTPDRIRRVMEHVRREGSSVWWRESPEFLLGDLAFCPECGDRHLQKNTDIMDVWFDSGVSHLAVLETRKELHWPAELYLEGSDQHRGWFQTSLLTSIATRNKPPFKSVLTHGFIVDGEGRKMSKSVGNVVRPQEVIDRYGADILRLWVASTDYRGDIRISETILSNLAESYRRIRNTARFLLGNLHHFDPWENSIAYKDMPEMDRWLLSRLSQIITKVGMAYDNAEFHVPTFLIHQFCVNELSSFYLDASKDRLYAEKADSLTRRSCQTVMWNVLKTLTTMLSPVLSFTMEEIWQSMRTVDPRLCESVFLTDWPVADPEWDNASLSMPWEQLLVIRSAISKALEKARSDGKIGHSLEATVVAERGAFAETANRFSSDDWALFLITSEFRWVDSFAPDSPAVVDEETGLRLLVGKASGEKCPRCWKYSETVNEKGLCPRCSTVLTE